jgi:soluble lytic murein transglycosylase
VIAPVLQHLPRPLRRLFACAAALLALGGAQTPPPPPEPTAAPAAASPDELHGAPQVPAAGAPPEAALTPPPDAEKAPLPPGFAVVPNPAFPPAEPAPELVNRGRRFTGDDLLPYFRDGPLAEARRQFDLGAYARARRLLEGQGDGHPVRYLRAMAALRDGDAAFAAAELSALAQVYRELSDRCLTHGGIAAEELSRWDLAADLFGRVPAWSKLYVDARLGLSRARSRQGDLQAAVAALEPLAARPAPMWGRDVGAEALIAIADLRARLKDREGERAALRSLWARHPLSPLAAHAERRLKGQKMASELVVDRAEVLVESHRNQQAVKVLEPVLPALKLPDPLACRAHFLHGKALRKERLHTRAIQALQPVVNACREPDLRARALYVLGSSRSIVDVPNGPATYEQLASEFPTHSFADDALFYAADLYVKSGRLDRALERLEAVAARYPEGDFLSEALFKAFWIHRARGETERALQVLDRIEKAFAQAEETYDVERARYWRARVLLDLGRREEAADLLERVALDHPATYYGLLSRSRLDEIDPPRFQKVAAEVLFPSEVLDPWPLYAGPLGEDPHFLAGLELLRMGFGEAASQELLAADRTRLPPEAVRLLVLVLSAAGDQRSAHAIARTSLRGDLSGRVTPRTRPIWEVAYPNAFRDLVERHCKTAGVDADLLQALMREESALDPKALSWAGALGLTQMMPYTARAVGKQIGLTGLTPKKLLRPEISIRLGSAHLSRLVKKYGGNQAFGLAAYNAGAAAVDRWRSDRPDAHLDEWVEEVPIAETRGYIKRVLRTFNTYQLLYRRGVPVQRVASR